MKRFWEDSWDFIYIVLFFLFLLSFVLVLFKEGSKDWKFYQKKYNALAKLLGKKTIPIRPIVIKTQWGTKEYCLTCHVGIENIGQSHPISVFGCTICHGGDPLSLDVKEAHRGLIGGKNPSDFSVVDMSCGRTAPNGASCHADRSSWFKNHIKRIRGSVMATMSGVINGILTHWKANPQKYYTCVPNGKFSLVPEVDVTKGDNFSLAIDHFRKMCAKCHAGVEGKSGTSSHASGCAACHAIYNDSGTYDGLDPTIPRDKFGYPSVHKLTTVIPTSQCLHCHNRSGREGTNYVGFVEGPFYGTPYTEGKFGAIRLMGDRYLHRVLPDIHFELGLHCIDCHTGFEIMGTGKVYKNMFEQVKIRCEDCHGTYKRSLKGKVVKKDDYTKFSSIFNPNFRVETNDIVAVTSEGYPIPNVKFEDGKWYLYSKVTGKKYKLSIITGTPEHRFKCQEKLECYSCHSAWSPLCYGCHDILHKNSYQYDYLSAKKRKGKWEERRGFIRFDRIILGVNLRGKISPIIFCQSEVFIKEESGFKRGPKAFVFSAYNPHTTRKIAKGCAYCHRDRVTLGLGSGIYNSKASGMDFPYSPDTVVVNGRTIMEPGIRGMRGLNEKEIKRALSMKKLGNYR